MIIGDNYQKLLIFELNNIWRYMEIFNNIRRYLKPETFTFETRNMSSKKILSNIANYRLVATYAYKMRTINKDTFLSDTFYSTQADCSRLLL